MADFNPQTPEDVIALATEGPPDEPPDVKGELWREALGWAKVIVFAVLFALFINYVIIVNATVPTGSMESTIRVNDRIIAFRLSFLFSEPQRYDIIVFRSPQDGILNVKRIIGLPGETVAVRNGIVYINGESGIRDDFVLPEDRYGNFSLGPDFPEQLIPDGHFFVLGDARGNSLDSRGWTTTPFVAQSRIQGRVVFRYFPGFRHLGRSS